MYEYEEIDKKNKWKGEESEKRFSEYLDDENIPFMRIDQKKDTFSKEFKSNNVRRPDFLIHTKNGVFNVDVKYRTKTPPKKLLVSELNDRFYLKQEEITELYNLQNILNLSVWIAFTDNEKEKIFYYAPISEIYTYYINISKAIEDIDYLFYKEIFGIDCYIRLPNIFLCDHLSFENGFYEKQDLQFIKTEAEYHYWTARFRTNIPY